MTRTQLYPEISSDIPSIWEEIKVTVKIKVERAVYGVQIREAKHNGLS